MIAEKIAGDVVKRVCFPNLLEDCSMYSYCMQDLVIGALKRYNVLQTLFRKLSLTPNMDNVSETFNHIMDDMFQEELNWGRVVTIYMFGVAIARDIQEFCTYGDVMHFTNQTFIPTMRQRVSPWIHNQGGWDAFLQHFSHQHHG